MGSPELSLIIERVQDTLDTSPDVVLLCSADVRALLAAACSGELPPSPPKSPYCKGFKAIEEEGKPEQKDDENSDFSILDADLWDLDLATEEGVPANGSPSIFDTDSDIEIQDSESSVDLYPIDSDFEAEDEVLQDFSGEPALTAEEQEQIIQQAIDAAREASGARDSDSDFGLELEEDEPEPKK